MITAAQIRRDFEGMQMDTVALVYDSEPGSGVPGSVSADYQPQVAGLEYEYERSIWIKSSAFTAEPTANTRITVDGAARTILNIHKDAAGALIRLDVGDQYA